MNARSLGLLIAACITLGVTVGACGNGDGDASGGGNSSKPAQPPPGGAVESDSKSSAEVWAVGDGADGSDSARDVAAMIERAGPDRVLYLGDVYDAGTAEEFERNYEPTYGELAPITAPTPGNHDWMNRGQGYDRYWKRFGVPTNRHFYSFKTGGWEIVSLNSESGLERGSPQRRWLRGALSERGTCRIAFWHRPYLNAGKHGDQRQVRPLWRALRGHAALVLTGHDHNMQHFKPRNGLVELVSGAGGHERYQSNGNDPRLVWDEDDEFGAVRLDLREGEARFDFVATGDDTLHSGRVRCRPLSTG